MTEIRKPYDPSGGVPIMPSGVTLAKQSMAAECDINNIMKRFEKTGLLDHAKEHGGRYGDFLSAPDFHTACNQVIAANDMFMSLPARVRERFQNDAAAFLLFAHDPANQAEMRDLGLMKSPDQVEGLPEPETEPDAPPKLASSDAQLTD